MIEQQQGSRGLVDAVLIDDGVRVEHQDWTDGTWRPQCGTVIVLPDGARAVDWDGVAAVDPLTSELAKHLVVI